MRRIRSGLFGSLSLLMGAASLWTPVVVNATDTTTTKVKVYEYAAKFLCEPGLQSGVTEQQGGSTLTSSVNVHNPNFSDLHFYVKLVDAWGNIHGPYYKYLPADGAMRFSCEEFFNGTDTFTLSPGSSFEGFLVVLGLNQIDVVGVHEVVSWGKTIDLDVVRASASQQSILQSKWTWFVSQEPTP